MAERLPTLAPGEGLLEGFLLPMGNSRDRLAKEIRVHPQRIGELESIRPRASGAA